VSFIEQQSGEIRALAEAGPTIFPAALPPRFSNHSFTKSTETQRGYLLGLITTAHVLAVVLLWAQPSPITLAVLPEQMRLTLIQLSKPQGQPAPEEPQQAPEQSEVAVKSDSAAPAEVEWARVANWRPKSTGSATAPVGSETEFGASQLLAGSGAKGQATSADGVDDPYAGASPIWAGNGAQSDLILVGAPNPGVLEQIRQRVAKTFRVRSGYARLTVMLDQQGAVMRVIQMDTDLPEPARKLLEESLVGRVVSVPRSSAGTVSLPEMTFG
jgi:hypothetical protein